MKRALVVVCLLAGFAHADDRPSITLIDLPDFAVGPIDAARIAELEKQGQLDDPALMFEYATQLGNYARVLRDRDPNAAKALLLRSVRAYKGLVDNDKFRDLPAMDVALFGYGLMLQSFKYMKEARAVYDKLLKNYPNSKFVPDAHLAFADYYYEQSQIADAEARYKQVLKFPKASVYWYAMYKLGWVKYQLNRYQEALEMFFQTSRNTIPETIRNAAKLGFVAAYAQTGKANRAYDAFGRVDLEQAAVMAQQLALGYEAGGQLDQALLVYRDLVAREPANANACAWHVGIVRLAVPVPDKAAAAEALVALDAKRPSKECHTQAVQIAGDVARLLLDQLKARPNAAMSNQASKLLNVYLAEHPNSGDTQLLETAAQLAWQRAEADPTNLDAWRDASVAFDGLAVATQTRTAALTASRAWRNALGSPSIAAPEVKPTKRKPPQAQPVPQRDQELLDRLDHFVATLGADDHDTAELRLVAAATYRKYHQHAKALAILGDMMQTDVAETAALMLLDSLAATQQLDQMQREIGDMIGAPKFLDDKPKLMATIARLRKR